MHILFHKYSTLFIENNCSLYLSKTICIYYIKITCQIIVRKNQCLFLYSFILQNNFIKIPFLCRFLCEIPLIKIHISYQNSTYNSIISIPHASCLYPVFISVVISVYYFFIHIYIYIHCDHTTTYHLYIQIYYSIILLFTTILSFYHMSIYTLKPMHHIVPVHLHIHIPSYINITDTLKSQYNSYTYIHTYTHTYIHMYTHVTSYTTYFPCLSHHAYTSTFTI